MPEQTKLFIWNNQNLFSTNYLEYRLPETDLWKAQKEKAAAAFEEIRKAYESIRPLNLGPGEEAGLEEKFIRPVLRVLGFELDIQPTTKRGTKKKRPDYALFKDDESYRAARKFKDNPDQFFSLSLTILEAKYWGRRLNDTDKKDVLDSRDPTAQTVKYLDSVNYHTNGKINWAILTNGKLWRLFYFRAPSRTGNYFELDLEEIISRGDAEGFLYFYLFFSKDAFLPDPVSGKTWLYQHLKGTEDYAARVSTKLKDRIFDQVFEGLATGFIHFRKTEMGITKETGESRREIFKGSLTLLYRLLFILYAESRNLLPVNEEAYYKVSLSKIKKDIYQDLKTTESGKMSKRSCVYWAKLQSLFDVVAKGDPGLNVPIYNGGLFEAPEDGFLSRHKMPDPFFADAVEQLTVDHESDYKPGLVPFIDYSSLNVRHLGDIYEGLLEFHIQIAETEIVEIKEKGKSVWKKLAEVKPGTKTYRPKKAGEVYIENSKHERKATGSYYTPHYIVEYIVKNTVGTVLEKRLETAKGLLSQIADLLKAQKKQISDGSISVLRRKLDMLEKALLDTIFDIKVLDPAMGSGHFLVYAVDFISDRIVSFLADYPENLVIKKIEKLRSEILNEIKRQGVSIDESKLTEVNLIKRMVMKRCIYGIDLNDMAVELAKLSLWLDSFTLGAPLSFLDHHLKCGNSLIGIFDISDVIVSGSEMYGKVQRTLSFMLQVSELTDATVSEAKTSYDLFKKGREAIEPLLRRFDASTAKHFIDTGWNPRIEQLAYSLNYKGESYAEVIETCKKALKIAKDKNFFHWKVEFPEVFYTDKGEKENPGFDCVIGNPPWGANFDDDQRQFLKKAFHDIIVRMIDSYMYFLKQAHVLSKKSAVIGLIVPNPFLTQIDAKKLREYLLVKSSLLDVIDLGDGVFGTDLANPSCIVVFQNDKRESNDICVSNLKLAKASEKEHLIISKKFPVRQISSDTYFKMKDYSFITDGFGLSSLVERLQKKSLPLLDLIEGEIQRGISADYADACILNAKDVHHGEIETGLTKPLITGHNVSRYYVEPSSEVIIYLTRDDNIEKFPKARHHLLQYRDKITCKEVLTGKHPWYALHRPRNPIIFSSPKLIGLTTTDRLMIGLDTENYFAMDNLYLIRLKDNSIKSNLFMISILNSALLSRIYELFAQESNRVLPQVKAENLYPLPIPCISFTTPEKERKEFFKEAVKLYERSKYEDIIKWAEYELALKRTDTSHDFLAYLAEQMIEMNKAKNEEIKGFLKWLEREIGSGIEDLANKTAIKEYHDHVFDHLLEVLKKNRNKILIDPSDRKKQELLEKHFTKSMAVLEPLKDKIQTTDNLIDQIVYKLYGLSDEEIRVVRGEQ